MGIRRFNSKVQINNVARIVAIGMVQRSKQRKVISACRLVDRQCKEIDAIHRSNRAVRRRDNGHGNAVRS